METIDILLITISSVIIIVGCFKCITYKKSLRRSNALLQFNTVRPLEVDHLDEYKEETEYIEEIRPVEQLQKSQIIITCI